MSVCFICDKKASKFCSGCRQIFYCSKDHQAQDWIKGNHKVKCRPFKVTSHPQRGRFIVATRKLKAGELIMKEAPICVGPRMFNPSPICLGCHNNLSQNSTKCVKCRLPLCSSNCEKSNLHLGECEFLQNDQKEFLGSDFDLLTPLRFCCRLLKEEQERKFELDFLSLEANLEEKRKRQIDWERVQTSAKRLKTAFNLDLPLDELEKIICILDCNCNMVLSKSGETLAALYALCSLLNHSCLPNARPIVAADNEMRIVSVEDIEAGHEISISYLDPFRTTLERRRILWMGKCFKCDCDFCKSDQFSSSSKCQSCEKAFLVSTNALDPEADWKCQNCEVKVNYVIILKMEAALSKEATRINYSSIDCMEKFLSVYEKLLHPNHAFLNRLRQSLCEGYGRLKVLKCEDDFNRKESLCRKLLQIYDKIEPRYSLLTGIICLELVEVLMRKKSPSHGPEIMELLKATETIFNHEDVAAPDGFFLLRTRELQRNVKLIL